MIRKATYEDMPVLMEIFRKARGIIRCGIIHLANGDPREANHMCGKIRKFVDSNKITDTL